MSDKVIKGSDKNFTQEVIESGVPVFVDFWAEWCGPCRMIGPFIDQIAQEYDGKLKVVKCNVDECPESASKFQVSSIPSLMLFKDGEVVHTSAGAMPLAQLKSFVEQVL